MTSTIIDYAYANAKSHPDKIAFRYLEEVEGDVKELSNKQLWEGAQEVACFLQSEMQTGSRVMLFYPPGLDFVKAFYGCLLAGMVAVPLYPPRSNSKSDRILKIAESCRSTVGLTTSSEINKIKASWDRQSNSEYKLSLYSLDSMPSTNKQFPHLKVSSSDTAFLQYTSGSTGAPKGVIITHKNIVANVTHLSITAGSTNEDIFVNWLPLFHDFGLITAVLWPVFLCAPSTLMAPATFVRNPTFWLRAISRYRGSICGAPNFAYDLCVKKIAPEDLPLLNLDCWRIAYNAAEPVKAETLRKFLYRFEQCGFRESAFYPGYGMAEATVFIAGGDSNKKPVQIIVDKHLLAQHVLEIAEEKSLHAMELVGCGSAQPPHDLRIVDPSTKMELKEGRIGEIWFSGPSVAPGYWELPDHTSMTFCQKIVGLSCGNDYLRTGDLGVKWNGELFVTGRIKDLIILNGKNYYPQDIEASACSAHFSVRDGHCAAFSSVVDNDETLIVVAEISREFFRAIDVSEVADAIRRQVALDCEVNIGNIVLIQPYKIPVTSSGKIQRRKTRDLYLANRLEQILPAEQIAKNTHAVPESAVEIFIASTWCSVLNVLRVGIHDNFFEIGGTSLAALEISAKVRKEYSLIELDIDHFINFPTIAQLAQVIELRISHARNEHLSNNVSQRRIIKI